MSKMSFQEKKNSSLTSHQFVNILSGYNSASVDCLHGLILKCQMPLTDKHRYCKGIIGDVCVIVLDSGSSPLPHTRKSDSKKFNSYLMVLLFGDLL